MAHPDGVALIVHALRNDLTVYTATNDRIYGGQIPVGAQTPLILVRAIARRPQTKPTTQWWELAVAVDVHDTDPGNSFQIACDVEDAVNKIVGTQLEGTVAVCEVTGSSTIEDGAFTPTRFRNVATVELTARNN